MRNFIHPPSLSIHAQCVELYQHTFTKIEDWMLADSDIFFVRLLVSRWPEVYSFWGI
jgi:hypothetical protein